MNKNITKESYDKNARALAEKFNNIDISSEISVAFSFLEKKRPFILEIGCGNGRDAKLLLKRAKKYLGVDISKNMIKIARKENPGAEFVVSGIQGFAFPEKIDLAFASASLLHCSRAEIKNVLSRLHKSLEDEGVVYMSLKYGKYRRVVKTDEYGTRVYYYYTKKDITNFSKGYKIVYFKKMIVRGQEWITAILKR